MLELHILKYLMQKEAQSALVKGRASYNSLSHFQQMHDIPKATFYRAVNTLLDNGFIVKQKRTWYAISDDYRKLCNCVKDAEKVRS